MNKRKKLENIRNVKILISQNLVRMCQLALADWNRTKIARTEQHLKHWEDLLFSLEDFPQCNTFVQKQARKFRQFKSSFEDIKNDRDWEQPRDILFAMACDKLWL